MFFTLYGTIQDSAVFTMPSINTVRSRPADEGADELPHLERDVPIALLPEVDRVQRPHRQPVPLGVEPVERRGPRPPRLAAVCAEYVKGLRWVLEYYYQGCPAWGW